MKLFSRSFDNNTKASKKAKHVDVTLTILSKGNLYLLVFYVQKIPLTTCEDWWHLFQWIY